MPVSDVSSRLSHFRSELIEYVVFDGGSEVPAEPPVSSRRSTYVKVEGDARLGGEGAARIERVRGAVGDEVHEIGCK